MRDYGRGDTAWDRRVRAGMVENDALRHHILTRIAEEGPLPARPPAPAPFPRQRRLARLSPWSSSM